MIKSPFFWLLFALLLSRINANCQVADDFTIKHYTSKNGLPQNSIRTLLMDDDRFLWMTTEGGLVRFDGQAFKVYNHLNTPAIKNDRFISVLKTMNGDFVAFDQAQSTFKITNGKPVSVHPGNRKTPPEINFDGSVPDISYLINCFDKNYSGFNAAERRGNPLTIFPISDNRFAVLLKNSLRIFNNEKSEYELSFSDYNAASFFQISGIIYFYDSSNQIYYFDLVNKSIKLARLVNSPTSKEINILKYLGKTIWSYSNPGVFFRENSNLFQIYSKDNASELYIKLLNTKLPENCIISSVILDPKSESIFIGTFTKGLYVFRKNKFKTLVYANSTVDINNSYYGQCETESGVVLTHIKKEFSIDGGKISSIPFRQISNKIVYKDKNNIIWTTRLDSIFYYNRTTKTLNFICAKDRSEFYCVVEDGDSLIIAGSKGIGSISNYTYKLNTKIINSDPDSKIESIIRGPDENIWMASCLGVSIIEKKTGEVQPLLS
ncbi:MAG: hypothetical protein IPP71_18915 [Bacteroidetes bacterium]|nr:hypothetical protein [Bacteroidota bacterium]